MTDRLRKSHELSAEVFAPFPYSAGRSCSICDDGWECEAHPGFRFGHPDEDDPDGICAGPGMPCHNGCLGVNDRGEPL